MPPKGIILPRLCLKIQPSLQTFYIDECFQVIAFMWLNLLLWGKRISHLSIRNKMFSDRNNLSGPNGRNYIYHILFMNLSKGCIMTMYNLLAPKVVMNHHAMVVPLTLTEVVISCHFMLDNWIITYTDGQPM